MTIVVEGGPDTLSAIQNDLRHNIPVVLIDVSSFSLPLIDPIVLSSRAVAVFRIFWRSFSLEQKH